MDMQINGAKRFDVALKVSDIPASMAAATESLSQVGGLFRTADQLITLATARALLDATAADAEADAVIGELASALRKAELASGPAKRATMALGKALRVAKAAKAPMTGTEALAEAREITAAVFDHDTKRRSEARAAAAQKKLDDAATKAAEKAAAGVEAAPAGEQESPVTNGLTVNHTTIELTEGEATMLEQYLREIRAAAEATAAAKRKAERDAGKAERTLHAA